MSVTHNNRNYVQPSGFARATMTITTNGSGAFSDTVGPFSGYLEVIDFDLGTLTSGAADVTVTLTSTGETVWGATNLSANKITRPKILSQDTAGANLTGEYSRFLLVNDTLTVTVAQGGDTKTATLAVAVSPA